MNRMNTNNTIRINKPGEIPEFIKEAQLCCGMHARTFLVDGKTSRLDFDGMFIVDTTSGEVIDERMFEGRAVFATALS